ncbi:hypothetical protein IFM89_030327 [Coptis chinensis]|uniref:Uncharacterized protein n=1 Tax=Coptis chinensis TaxID=261450 RepID=A0A835IEL8_9MAGN|nr:hypothetical protein IFM89_030327 [Coptis chinensis]
MGRLQAILVILPCIAGFISLCRTLVMLLRWVWVTFLRPPKNLQDYGSWALITGATNGIGKALAFELASKGLNLVLISRNPSKLQHTSNDIRERYGSTVQVKYIVIDFSKDNSDEIVSKIEEGIHGLDVGLLINNAALGYPYPKYFHEVESEYADSVVRANVDGVTWVTKAVLPVMLRKKKGAIVNIGSGAGSSSIVPSYPLFTVYAATKAYIVMFSRSISLEYKQYGIDIQCQIPLLVATKMASIRRTSFFIPSPEMFAKASLRWIGYEHICLPYWPHSLELCVLRALPDAFLNWLLFKYFLITREKGMLKELMKNKNEK